jgi:ribosomal protein S18 acetylase RimI-like enzyme
MGLKINFVLEKMRTRYITRHYHGLEIKTIIDYLPNLNRYYNFYCYSDTIKIGRSSLTYVHQKSKVYVKDFYIEEPYREKGHGSRFWEFVENYIKRGCKPSEFLGRISDVDDFDLASSFWHKMGFEVVDNRSSPDGCFVGPISKRVSETS